MTGHTSPRRVGRTALLRHFAVALVFLAAAGLWVALLGARRWNAGPEAFDVVTWEVTTAPGKWLYHLGAPLRRDPDADEAVARYFALDDRSGAEARRIGGTVEAAIEGRLDAALREAGFADIAGLSVWPPVDIDLTGPPRVLAVSPRERIELTSRELLRPGLDLSDVVTIEQRAESAGGRSAVVLPLGGLSTYPAIVTDGASYGDTVEAAAHEWVHHYLAFYPLGWWAPVDRDALRINETVADIAGDEIGAAMLARSGEPPLAAGNGSAEARRAARAALIADRDRTLRVLRLEVDALLQEGRIDEAERRMEEVRVELAGRGVAIRRLNQAYLAWTGTYAARGDSIDVLGGQLREVRRLGGSLPHFLEAVRGVTSRTDVDRVLAELRATAALR